MVGVLQQHWGTWLEAAKLTLLEAAKLTLLEAAKLTLLEAAKLTLLEEQNPFIEDRHGGLSLHLIRTHVV